MIAEAKPDKRNRLSSLLRSFTDRWVRDTDAGERDETAFGYDAIEPKNRRKAVSPTVGREDWHTSGSKRTHIQATAAEVARNQSLAAWMVRRHLDYVAAFQFRPRNESKMLNDDIAGLMQEQSRPNAMDIAGRFNREKFFRLMELRRVMDGDTLGVRMNDMTLQGVQADLLRNPENLKPQRLNDPVNPRWLQGVNVNAVGRPLRFGVWRRHGLTGKRYHRTIPAANTLFYGFFDNYAADQTRGVSPIVTALAPLQDVYENFNFALAKMKVSQILAVAFYRDKTDPLGDLESHYGGTNPDPDDDDVEEPTQYDVNFGNAPKVFDLDPGDRAEFLESAQPSNQFQDFTQLVVMVALKALDIPYSFYDESHTNFFGSRAAWLHYERSCLDKRNDQVELRQAYTSWQYAGFIRDGRLKLPRSMTVADLRHDWVPLGMPWWNPTQEVKGHISAMSNALDTPQRICRGSGSDFYDNVDDIADAIDYARQRGVPLEFVSKLLPNVATAVDAAGAPADGTGTQDDATATDDDATAATADGGADWEALKKQADAYGVAVRAGVVTPIEADEAAFRESAGLVPMDEHAAEQWKIDGGVRRPITLKPSETAAGADDPNQPPNLPGGDEPEPNPEPPTEGEPDDDGNPET